MKGCVDGSVMSKVDILSSPYTSIQFAFEKRRRNLEKRKIRLNQYEDDLNNGKKLSEQQVEARYCTGEVDTQLEFLKEITRTLNSLQREYAKSVKQRADLAHRKEAKEAKSYLQSFIAYQNIVSRFCRDDVKNAFTNGSNDAVKITEDECKMIEELSDKFDISVNKFSEIFEKSGECAGMVYQIISGCKEKVINNYSGAQIVEILKKIASCDYMQAVNGEVETHISNHEENKEVQKDPKVVFVHGLNGSSDVSDASDDAVDTEFGFESSTDKKLIVRDPPPPIPLPTSISDDTVEADGNKSTTKSDKTGLWAAGDRLENLLKSHAVVEGNGFMNGKRAAMRGDRHFRGNGIRVTFSENEHNKSGDYHQGLGQSKFGGRDGRRLRSGRGGRGNAFPRSANTWNGNAQGGVRNGGAGDMGNGFKMNGKRGGFGYGNGYGYGHEGQVRRPQQQQLGFNFSTDAL